MTELIEHCEPNCKEHVIELTVKDSFCPFGSDLKLIRLEVQTPELLKMQVFWHVMPCCRVRAAQQRLQEHQKLLAL